MGKTWARQPCQDPNISGLSQPGTVDLNVSVIVDLRDRDVVGITYKWESNEVIKGMPTLTIEEDVFKGPIDFDNASSTFSVHALQSLGKGAKVKVREECTSD